MEGNTVLDRIDFEILALLRNNARISNKDVADKLGIAASTSLVRIRSLRRRGVITGFHAEIDPASLGLGIQAMIAVKLNRHFKPNVEAFRSYVLGLPEVVQLYHVAGPIDFLIHVWTHDANHLRELAMTALTSREEVAHIETELIFEHKRSLEDLPFPESC